MTDTGTPQLEMNTRSAVRTGTRLGWLRHWWHTVHLGATVLVLALSPSSYSPMQRRMAARRIYLGTAPLLLWFTILSSLVGLVIIRIVVVTASSYGLSQYALQMVVRVLVLELIPLTAAVFVALRISLPDGAEIAAMRADGRLDAIRREGGDPVTREVLPRVLAGLFAVAALAALSSVVTLVLAYLSVYGFASGGLAHYTRTVGHVFQPPVALVFVMKTVFLSLAVTLIPAGSALHDLPRRHSRSSAEIQVLVRLFLVVLLIETLSLAGNYY